MATLFKRSDTGNWYVSYMIDGQRVKKKIGKNKRLAELFLKEIEVKLAREELDLAPKDKPTEEAFREFVEEMKATKAERTWTWYEEKVGMFLDAVKKPKLSQYRPADINRYKLKRLKKVSPGTVGGDLRAMSVFFSFAIRRGYLRDNSCRHVEKPRNVPQNPPRFLSKDEIDRLLEAAQGHPLRPLIATAIYAGLRRSELVWLEWEDINFKRDTITVRNKDGFHTKSYKSRTIPLNQKLKEMLLPYRKDSGWCFPNSEGGQYKNNVLNHFKRICREAGIEKCGIHDLRHTFASQLVMAGVSIYKVSRWLGHSDVKTTMIYAHLAPQDADINRI